MSPSRLLFLGGNMCDARLWAPLVAHLELAGLPPLVGALEAHDDIDDMAHAMLAEHPGLLVPIGFSMGAIVAATMARIAPERIAGMALIAFNASADLPERAAVRPRQQAAVARGALADVVTEELKPNYLSDAHQENAGLRALLMDMALDLGPTVFTRQSEALRTRENLCPALPLFDIPVLLVAGAEDRLCPPAWHQRWAQAIGDNAEVHIIPDAGHMVPLEQPVALGTILINWLQKEGLWVTPS